MRPATLRIGDEVGKGYMKVDFDEVFRRYIPRPEIEAVRAELAMRRPSRAEAAEPKSGDEN